MFAYCVSDFVKYKLSLLPKKECNFAFQLQAALGQAFALSCSRIFTMVKGFVRNSQVTVHFIVQELGKKQSFWIFNYFQLQKPFNYYTHPLLLPFSESGKGHRFHASLQEGYFILRGPGTSMSVLPFSACTLAHLTFRVYVNLLLGVDRVFLHPIFMFILSLLSS